MGIGQDLQRSYISNAAEKAGLSVSALARKAGVVASTLNRFMNQPVKHLLSGQTLAKVSRASGLSIPDELRDIVLPVSDEMPSEDGAPSAPLAEGEVIEASPKTGAGLGFVTHEMSTTDEFGNTTSADLVEPDRWRLPPAYLRHELRVANKDARIVEVLGDSMSPTLHSGDRVMVDTSDKKPSPSGVFVLWDGIANVIRRLDYIDGSDPASVEMIADNQIHNRRTRTLEEINIVGRVIWVARRL